MNECFVCGANVEVIKDKPYVYKDGGIEATLYGLTQYHCSACDETFTPIPTPQKLHRVIGQVICEKNKGLLTGDEIRFLRKTMDMKANELAQIMGTDVSTISRWENNKKDIGDGNDRLLRMVFIHRLPYSTTLPDTVETLKGIPKKRHKIKEKHNVSLNPAEWMLGSCCPAC